MRIVVTGAAGFIGSHLCDALLARGHEVVGIDGFTRFYSRELKERNIAALRRVPSFTLHERNLLDARGLAPALAGTDALCHMAGRPGVRGGAPVVFDAGNVRTTEAVMHAAARAGVRRVVLASSSSVYGPAAGPVREDARPRPLSPYGRSKRRAELLAARLALRHGLELITLRYFTVYGPRQRPDMAFARFTRAALNGGEMPLLGDGRQRRDFTYVGDAAEATALAVERGRPGAVYNAAGGRPVALADALRLLGAALGRAPALTPRPADAREPRSTAADLRLARMDLGWEPRTTLELGLRRQVEHAALAAA
jgi:nucleoside-diphosphate-sugar epimerase